MTEQTPTPADTAQPSPAPSESTTPTAQPATGSDLVHMPDGNLDARIRYANALAQAGDLIPAGLRDGRNANPGKVLLAIETGGMLGIHPVAAMNGVNIIDGKATLAPALMSGLVRRAGHKLRVTTAGTVEGGDLAVTATLVRSDDPDYPFTATWTPHRAARAGLCTYALVDGVWAVRARSKHGGALPWEAYTEAMLKARAIGEVCREGAEDVLMGIHYTPEELGANVDEHGMPVSVDVVVDLHAAKREPEPTPEQVAADAVRRALAATTVGDLVGLWRALANVVGGHSWAGEYADLNDYAKRTHVDHPYDASADRPTLLDAFGIIKTRITGEGGTGEGTRPADGPDAPQGTPTEDDVVEGTVEHDETQDAPATDDADVVDADVEPDAPVDDPWQTPGPQSLDEHDAAIDRMAAGLGATVVTDEAATPRERVAAAHTEQLAQRERTTPAEELGGSKADGAGRAAMRAARAALDASNEQRRAAQAAGATVKGRGK